MLNNIYIGFLLSFFVISGNIYSQKLKKFEKFYSEGNEMFRIGEFDKAIDFFNKSLKLNPLFCPSIYKLGLSYKKNNNFKKYEENFTKYIEINCINYNDEVSFGLGEYNFLKGMLKKSSDFLSLIEDTLKFIDYSRIKNNVEFNLNSNIKSVIDFSVEDTLKNFFYQYSPFYDKKSSKIYFTVRKGDRLFDDENIFTVRYKDRKTFGAMPFEFLNTENNEGTVSLSGSGDYLVFTYCVMDFKKNSCDLYYSQKVNGAWESPKKFNDKINSEFWDSQPNLYNDILFFVSNRPGGKGGRDIYFSKRLGDNEWDQAKNLEVINSQHEDISPIMFNEVLYFASDRSDSYGGYDIFYSSSPFDKKSFSKNVGSKVNSYLDEISIFVSDNIFMLTQEDKLNPNYKSQIFIGSANLTYPEKNKISFVSIDSSEMKVIDSDLYLISEGIKKIINKDESLIDASYKNALVLVESLGYFPKVLEIKNDSMTVYMRKIKEKFILENIYFDFDSYELNIESKKYLDIIYLWLKDNDQLKIEISGHTDKTGDDEYNFQLSKNRAHSVYNYLKNKEHNFYNLSFKGYGSSVPVEKNYEGVKNRRIEFRILNNEKY